jgi:transcriptional regulator with XRE-family HTH domain
MNPFGMYLASLRLQHRLKQKDLAEALGVNASYISGIESGRKSPPSSKLINEIAKVMALSKAEKSQLWNYADQSIKVVHIPDDLPLEGYAFMQELRKAMGSLSSNHFDVLRSVVSLSKSEEQNGI